MGKYIRKILVAWLVAALVAALACPALALSRPKTARFWDWSASAGGFGGQFGSVTGYSAGKTCPSSSDSYHHGSKRAGFGNDEDGNYTMFKCEYCDQEFKVYSSFNSDHSGGFGSDFEQSYDDQVAKLPATAYNSAGKLLWQPKFSDCDSSSIIHPHPGGFYFPICQLIRLIFKFLFFQRAMDFICRIFEKLVRWHSFFRLKLKLQFPVLISR